MNIFLQRKIRAILYFRENKLEGVLENKIHLTIAKIITKCLGRTWKNKTVKLYWARKEGIWICEAIVHSWLGIQATYCKSVNPAQIHVLPAFVFCCVCVCVRLVNDSGSLESAAGADERKAERGTGRLVGTPGSRRAAGESPFSHHRPERLGKVTECESFHPPSGRRRLEEVTRWKEPRVESFPNHGSLGPGSAI